MPVVERIDWALGQLNMGRSGHIVIGPAKDPALFKVKLLLKPVGSGAPAPVTRSGLEAVLLHIKQLAMVNVAMDRGHRHTTGAAEMAIWIRCGAVRPAKHRNRHGCHEEEEKDEEKEKDSKPNAEQAPPEATGASTANALTAETAPDTPRNDETEARGAAADEKQEIEEAEKKDTEKAEKKDAHAADEDAQPQRIDVGAAATQQGFTEHERQVVLRRLLDNKDSEDEREKERPAVQAARSTKLQMHIDQERHKKKKTDVAAFAAATAAAQLPPLEPASDCKQS